MAINILDYAKKLGIEIPSATAAPIDIEAGKAGYEQYLADLEKLKKAEEKTESETWLDKIGRWMAGSHYDTTLPLNAGMNQAIEGYRNTPTNYKSKPTDDWTDEEKWAFGEKYANSKNDAYLFAEELNNSKAAEKKRNHQIALEKWTNRNAVNRVLGSVASLGINAVGGGVGYLDALAQRAAGRDTIEQHDVLLPHEIANTMQGAVASHLNDKYGTINEDVWLLGGKGLGDVYGLGMSVAQSALGASTGGSAGTLIQFFGMAASNGVTDALERGATADQALAFGTISGAAEAITEMVSVDKLLGITSAEGVQNVFKNVLKQAGQEAGEEFTTAMINNVADNWIMGGKSQFYVLVDQLVASGMSVEEAKKKAWIQTIEDIAFDTLSGALSGSLSGAGATAINRGVNQFGLTKDARAANKNALETYAPIQNDLIAEGKQHKTSEKVATKMENKLAKGKELSGYDLRTLAYETENAARADDVETTRKAIVEQMKAKGLSDAKAKRLGEIALNKAIGHEVSKLQEMQLKNNEIASKVYRQISKDVMESGVGDSAWAEATPIRKLRAELESQRAAEEMQNGKMPTGMPQATQSEVASPEINSEITTTAKLKQMKNAVVTDAAKLDTLNQLVEESKTRDVSGKISEIKAKNKQPVKMEVKTSTEKAIAEEIKKFSAKDIKGKYTIKDGKRVYKTTKDSKLNIDGVSSSLTREDIIELSAIEKIANELGVDIYVYETHEQNGERVYTDKDGKRYTDSGYYDTKNNTIHIDLRAGMKGEGTMLYTASHEVVHFIKKNASDHFDALEKLVTKALVDGGYSVEKLIKKQKDILKQNGWKGTEDNFEEVAREEMVADACMKFLASKNAVAQIQALKTENKGLWSALKRFFTSFFTKINNVYKNTSPDAPEAEYIGSMYKKAKSIRDAFMEGAVAASKNAAQTQAETQQQFEKNYQKSKDVRKNARYTREHIAQLQSLDASTSTVPMDKLVERYESIIRIWNELGGEINSDFLKQWNDKSGKDRAFTVFKAQAGYKYNVELSSMCKKGIPLFEAIDQIVRSEVMSQLKTKTLGKAEKEVLYELLKERKFDIPCAICYVEQARQREGDIIDAFLDGKVEKTSTGKTKTYKIGWNETFDALEKGMKARGVDYTFAEVDRSIASDSYAKETMPVMDEKTQKAFYSTLLQLINKEITRYNAEKDAKTKARMPLKSVTPAEIKRCLGGTLPANLKLYKTIAMNPDSRFRIKNDLLYSSATTTNLASFHHDLYSLFNMQGGVSGYKSKQGAVVYWGDILSKKWDSSKLRKEGGVRNQSNSDFMMYTLLDQAQMYIDFTAKGYYLQAYTKVISELKLFGLSKGKINASLIPRVEIYRKDNGFEVDIEKTRENAGLDKDGNPIYDDIEGIPHEEAFMLIEDADYSKNIGGICIGYSDKHISKLLDDARIQLIIGYHDKTDDPDKRYYGARYAKNYNGENEARVKNADGTFTTKHVGFNKFVIAAEKLFKKGVTSTEYNGKTYKYDDIPKLAADMYLKMCKDKNYIPAYDQFSSHENYYKLLADFSLYDSEGHYAPHQKVAYEMPDVVPYLDEDGNKKYMPSKEYIKKELEKELTVRDDISATLSDHSENGLIPQFVKIVNEMHESKDIRRKSRITPKQDATYMDAVNRDDMKTAQRMVDEAAREAGYKSPKLYHGTSGFGFTTIRTSGVETGVEWSPFFATNNPNVATTYSGEIGIKEIGTKKRPSKSYRELSEEAVSKLKEKNSYSAGVISGKTDTNYLVEKYGNLMDSTTLKLIQSGKEGAYATDREVFAFVPFENGFSLADYNEQSGNYGLYANIDDFLVIDGHEKHWDRINSKYGSKTRTIAENAYKEGYPGVIIKNIIDTGMNWNESLDEDADLMSDVYIFFNPQAQVKSADPVTYDDKGNVIPLSERFNPENKDIRHKARYTEYNKPITIEDVKILRDILQKHGVDRVNINDFDSVDLEGSQKWAYKFYKTDKLGTKSPFFRAWFGDWREHDNKTRVLVVAQKDNNTYTAGKTKNEDVSEVISWGQTLKSESYIHSAGEKAALKGIYDIEDIIQNAIYLDTFISNPSSKSKMPNTAFMHSFYTLYQTNTGELHLLKLFVEEAISNNEKSVFKRAYELKDIKKVANIPRSVLSTSGGLTDGTSATTVSIADLFSLVKQYDKDFSPKSVNPALLNEDGTPKEVYHGTKDTFDEFKQDQSNKYDPGYLGTGFYFTDSIESAEDYSKWKKGHEEGKVMPVYLRMTNPLILEDNGEPHLIAVQKALGLHLTDFSNYLAPLTKRVADAITAEATRQRYDGIIRHNDLYNETTYVVFDGGQIKSSTDNIGTFDFEDKHIRHKARTTVTTESTPYVSPTANAIVMDIDSEYDSDFPDKVFTASVSTQIAFTNTAAGIERIGKKFGVDNIESLVQAARVASHQAEEMIGGNQYRIGSAEKTYLGEGLQKIIQPIEEKGEETKQAFFDYLFHYHNADRMSLERRSVEWLEEKKTDHQKYMQRFKELQKEQLDLNKEKTALSRRKEDSPKRQSINNRLAEIKREFTAVTKLIRKLQKEIDSFTTLKNKPVIGLNHNEIEARKAEISKRIEELIAERKSLGRSKLTLEKRKAISQEIADLISERKSLSAEVDEAKSKEIIAEYEKNYDYFKDVAEKIWNYNKNLNQYRVDTGLIDQETFDYLNKLYPHYVPSYRADSKTGIAAVKGKNNLAVNQSIKGAKGSTKDLLNPIVIMARQTMETVRAGRVNQIARALYDGAGSDKTYLAEISKKKVNKAKMVDLDPMELRPKDNQVTFFKDGEKITLQVSKEIFAGFDAFTPTFDIKNPLLIGAKAVMDGFKALVTSYNPTFIIRNMIRDLQDAAINSKYPLQFLKNYGVAAAQITSDGEMWRLYRAMGGSNVDVFDFDKGFKAMQNKRGLEANVKDSDAGWIKQGLQFAQSVALKIKNANAYVEALPRLAEFISSIQAGNTAEQAMLDAADVTTNFARSGKVTKALNTYAIPFLNAQVQGFSKSARNVTSSIHKKDLKRSIKEFSILAAKAIVVGIIPFALNSLLYRDDEDYEKLREEDKENYYLFKVGNKFLKLPRGRMASVLAGAYNRTENMISGEEKAWEGYLKNASNQMSPVQGMSRTIFSPFTDVKNNVTWYGGAIEGKQFENVAPAQRYDESTSSIAIAMAKFLNNMGVEASPKKIHYLLDQYSGVIGDFVLPATSKKAEKGFISGNFTIDPVTSNKLSDSFYDLYYEAQYAKNADENNDVAEYQVKHLNRVKSSISEMYDEIAKIQSSDKSDKEKLAEVKTIQILINEMYKTAIEDYPLITNAINATKSVDDNYRYVEVVRMVYGAEAALEEWHEDTYAKSKILKKAGVSYDAFYQYFFSTRGIESDKDKLGNTISGSKRKKVIAEIDKLKISKDKKLLLIAISGYALSESDQKKLCKYLNSLNISKSEKKELAEMCGLTYKNGKITPKS